MKKKELIEAIALDTQIPEAKVKSVIDSFFKTIGNTLGREEQIKIIGFLDFSIRKTSDTFIHPITKAVHKSKYPKAIRIKIGKTLKNMANNINESSDEDDDSSTSTKTSTAKKSDLTKTKKTTK